MKQAKDKARSDDAYVHFRDNCYNCGQHGHVASKCPMSKRSDYGKQAIKHGRSRNRERETTKSTFAIPRTLTHHTRSMKTPSTTVQKPTRKNLRDFHLTTRQSTRESFIRKTFKSHTKERQPMSTWRTTRLTSMMMTPSTPTTISRPTMQHMKKHRYISR